MPTKSRFVFRAIGGDVESAEKGGGDDEDDEEDEDEDDEDKDEEAVCSIERFRSGSRD